MKTRDLLNCDVRVFGRKIQTLKHKELMRHIERIAGDLGERDTDALMSAVLEALFTHESLPDSGAEEMRRVLRALESRILVTADNEDQVLRLVALCVASVRAALHTAMREERLAARTGAGSQHHHHHHHAPGVRCSDPHCTEHATGTLGESAATTDHPAAPATGTRR
jgi:hypothetical protein